MFKRKVMNLDEVIDRLLRQDGLETPLKQKRLLDAWETVVGSAVNKYTAEKFITNQTLHVKIVNPALRQDLTMMRSQLVRRLNDQIGSMLITDIHIY